MKKNNFLTILNTLTSEEIRKFEIHLNANFRNSKILLQISNYYLNFYKKKKTPPELEIVYQKLFGAPPKIKRPLAKLQNGLSDLFLILKNHLVQVKVLEMEFEKEFLWLNILEKKGLSKERKLHLKKIQAQQKENKSVWGNLNQMKLLHHDFFRNSLEKENPAISLIEDSIQSLDDFYFSLQLKYAAELQNRKNLLSIPSPKSPLLRPIINVLKKEATPFSLPVNLYFKLYQFLQKRNYQNFSQLKTFLYNQKEHLHAEEQSTVLIYLINYLAQELKNGNHQYRKETLELYKFGLTGEKVLIHHGIIDPITFQNVVNLACHEQEFNWTENFILDYQKYLANNIREENTSIAKAMLHFEKKDFQNVITNISDVKFKENHFILRARIYLLACQYEMEETEELDIDCQSFVRYVRRITKLGEASKQAAIQFGLILNHLVHKKMKQKQIENEINSAKSLYFKSWLIKKLDHYSPFP